MAHKNKEYIIDLIMLSKFGKGDGGRETWIYNFIPELLNDNRIKLKIFGYKTKEDEDNTELLRKLDKTHTNRVEAFIITGKKNKFPKFLSMLFQLKSFLKNFDRQKSDCAIAMGIFEVIIMLANKRFNNGLKIVWLRTIFLHEKSYRIPEILVGLARKIEYYLLKKADIIIANGDDVKAYYEQQYGLNITVIKNAVDAKKWDMSPVTSSEVLKVAYIGRLSKVKGIEPFMDLVKKVKNSSNAELFEFHIVGESNNYNTEVKKLQDEGLIIYHDRIDNEGLPVFLKDIHICVALTFASSSVGGGGTSNALLEQMAASKIIIAWDNVIFQQLLNVDIAYLVEQYSVSGLNTALLDIYSNQDEAIKKGISAKEAIRPYTIDAHVDQFRKLLD